MTTIVRARPFRAPSRESTHGFAATTHRQSVRISLDGARRGPRGRPVGQASVGHRRIFGHRDGNGARAPRSGGGRAEAGDVLAAMDGPIAVLPLGLPDPASIDTFAAAVAERWDGVDILIN